MSHVNEADILRQRLAQSQQYRRMIAEQHADAKHNVVHYEQKLTEAREQECELEHRLGVLDVEAERFKRQIKEAEENGE
jgi:chromosome segregation ATPase